jgi:hypothetical protein
MPLIPSVLETQLLALFTIDENGNSSDGTGPSASAKAAKLAQIIDTYIKTATVNVTTTGTIIGVSPSGPVSGTSTGTGIGTLS